MSLIIKENFPPANMPVVDLAGNVPRRVALPPSTFRMEPSLEGGSCQGEQGRAGG